MKRLLLFLSVLLSFCVNAQVVENFSGPNITSAYPWQGDLEKFRIEKSELQLFAREATSEALLYLDNTTLYNNEWRCHIKSDRTSSSSNYCCVYLFSKNNSSKYPGYALLVRIGYSNKKITLCQQFDGESPVPLLEGMPIGDGAFDVEIKVTSDDKGEVSLYCKESSSPEYIPFGSVKIHDKGEKGYFMLYAKYTTNYSRNKYFDDVFISQYKTGGNTDPEEEGQDEPIRIDKIEEISANSIRLYFNVPVDEDKSSFLFSLSGIDDEIEVYASNEDACIYQLEWGENMERGTRYTLFWEGIFDYEGNECKGSHSFLSTKGEASESMDNDFSKGSIIINEVMANPNGLALLPQTEYVELFNTTSSPVSLKGWSFIYNNKATVLEASTLPGNGYVVLFRAGRDISVDQGGLSMPLSAFPAQLANDGKTVGLLSPAGQTIDEIYYPKAKAGLSWERKGDEWVLSTDSRGGTPGSKNSIQNIDPADPPKELPVSTGEIIFNEILPNPFAGGSEYIELYNRSDKELSVSTLSIATRKTDGSLSTQYPLAGLNANMLPEDYLVLTRDKAGVIPFYMVEDDEDIREVKIPLLANTTSTLVLFRTSDGEVIDEVAYSSKWHAHSVKEQKGVALERINPEADSNDAANWTSASSIAGYGTPGYQNSQYLKEGDENITHIEEPAYSKEKREYYIAYHLNQPGYNCRAWIYNLSGIRVAEVANNELTGTNGVIIWDGMANNGARLHQGLYIIYLELYHPNGEVIQFKKPFLIYSD